MVIDKTGYEFHVTNHAISKSEKMTCWKHPAAQLLEHHCDQASSHHFNFSGNLNGIGTLIRLSWLKYNLSKQN